MTISFFTFVMEGMCEAQVTLYLASFMFYFSARIWNWRFYLVFYSCVFIGMTLNLAHEALHQEIYIGFISQLHNDSFLGMSKERGGISF